MNLSTLAPEFAQYEVMTDAIDRAVGVKAELTGEVSGMLLAYLRDARDQAAEAMFLLVTANPRNETEVFALQKRVAAYGHLVGWINDTLSAGELAEQDWENARGSILESDDDS